MVDKVKPIGWENTTDGGSTNNLNPSEIDPDQDYISTKGVAFENQNDLLIDVDASGNIQYRDENSANYTTNPSGYIPFNTLSEYVFEQQTGLRIGEYSFTNEGGMVLLDYDLLVVYAATGTFIDVEFLKYQEI